MKKKSNKKTGTTVVVIIIAVLAIFLATQLIDAKPQPNNPKAPDFYWEYNTTDGGTSCTDNSQCQGACIADATNTTGTCSDIRGGKSNNCGTTMNNGIATYSCIIA